MKILLKRGHISAILACIICIFIFFGLVEDGYTKEIPRLAKGVFLIANKPLAGSYFRNSVILIVEHDIRRTSGLIINKPLNQALSKVLPDIKQFEKSKKLLYLGGPVMPEMAFLLFRTRKSPQNSIKISDKVYFSHKVEALSAQGTVLDNEEDFQVYSGYSGWLPGQLEREISRGSWRVVTADPEIVFEKKPEDIRDYLLRYEKTKQIGIMAKY